MAIDDLMTLKWVEPPPICEDVTELHDEPARLAVSGKTRNLWALGDLAALEALWVFDINERQFAELLPGVDPLYLRFCGLRVADLSGLGRLDRLRALEIDWNTKVTEVDFLRQLGGLELLALVDCCKVHDIGAIADLGGLRFLELSGGMWTTFRPKTLAPLASLTQLERLSMTSIRVSDQSLVPLADLTSLRWIGLSNQFPTEEFARLSVALPETECTHFAPYLEHRVDDDGSRQVMVIGKGKPFLTLP